MFPLFKRQCKSVQPDLWDYVAERLPEGTLEKIERHLTTCKVCRQEAETLRHAQNMLLEARLEEPPAPRQGWSDLQARLDRETTTVLTYAPPVMATETRVRALARWTPSFAMVGSCVMLFCSAGLTYRMFSLQQNMAHFVNAPAPINNVSLTSASVTKKTTSAPRNPISLVERPPVFSDNSKRQGSSTKAASSIADRMRAQRDENSIHLVPAGYVSNPEITDPAPKPSMLKYAKPSSQGAERPKTSHADREYIMGTLTPTSRDSDSAY